MKLLYFSFLCGLALNFVLHSTNQNPTEEAKNVFNPLLNYLKELQETCEQQKKKQGCRTDNEYWMWESNKKINCNELNHQQEIINCLERVVNKAKECLVQRVQENDRNTEQARARHEQCMSELCKIGAFI